MDNPLLTPDKNPSELQKVTIHYEHVADNRQTRRRPVKLIQK